MTDHPFYALELLLAQVSGEAGQQTAAELLDEGFTEIGASGRHYDRMEALAAIKAREAQPITLINLTIRVLGERITLVTYESTGLRPAMRSSIWKLQKDGWKLVFHQGTPK